MGSVDPSQNDTGGGPDLLATRGLFLRRKVARGARSLAPQSAARIPVIRGGLLSAGTDYRIDRRTPTLKS